MDELSDLVLTRNKLREEIQLLKQRKADEERNLRNITQAVQAMRERLQRIEEGKLR